MEIYHYGPAPFFLGADVCATYSGTEQDTSVNKVTYLRGSRYTTTRFDAGWRGGTIVGGAQAFTGPA